MMNELSDKKVFIRLAVPADAPDMAEVHMRSWEVAYKDIIPAEYIRECGFAPDGKTKILDCGKPLTAIRMSRDL